MDAKHAVSARWIAKAIVEDLVTFLILFGAHNNKSLYSLIGDFFMIWRVIKDFKSNIMFSASFDYDIDII